MFSIQLIKYYIASEQFEKKGQSPGRQKPSDRRAVPYRISRYRPTAIVIIIIHHYKLHVKIYFYQFQPFKINILKIGRRGDIHEGIWNNFVKKNWKKVK